MSNNNQPKRIKRCFDFFMEHLAAPIVVFVLGAFMMNSWIDPPKKSQFWNVKTTTNINRQFGAVFNLEIDKKGNVEGVSYWTGGSGSEKDVPNKIKGTIKNDVVNLTRYLGYPLLGETQTWTGTIINDGTAIEGKWSGFPEDASGTWTAEIN